MPEGRTHSPVTDRVSWSTNQPADSDRDLPFEAPPHAPGVSAGAPPSGALACWTSHGAGGDAAVADHRVCERARLLHQARQTKLKVVR